MMKVSEIVAALNLLPHPEGGFYTETFRDTSISLPKSQLPPQYKVDRPVSSVIYFLMPSGDVSHLHRIPCAETWHFYKGEPLTVVELTEDGGFKKTVLGSDIAAGHQLQYTVPPNVWFGSYPTMDVDTCSSDGKLLAKAPSRDAEHHFSLVGCTCAPAFQFEDFELAKRADLLAFAPKAEALVSYLTFPD
ncbi:hypothetical protein GIB67_013100 [Kingdonia uniflora]|uniref:DUF985 domain-containing protein n=1 Tax=Kingdonia uniflora TaxID=39325 RepID=A0A7J7NP64_9MAGN|nr:hypothetical protein GIB67_013100 [Kingdonia uniflora]